MTFASEVAQANSSRGESAAPPPPPTLPTGEAPVEHQLEMSMPAHGEVHPEQKEAVVAAPVVEPPKQGKIRIGTEVFETREEAIQYAEELQRTIMQKDAYEQGKLAAQPKQEETAKEKDFFEELEGEIFENPREAMRKLHAKVSEDTRRQIQQEQQAEQTKRETWNSFYSANSDLATQKEVVDYVLQKNWNEIGHLPGDKGLRILAEKTRAFLGSTKLATLPTRELQSASAVVPHGGSPAVNATAKEKPQSLDFISQVNKHRRREAVK
jgi:hypothetical protein